MFLCLISNHHHIIIDINNSMSNFTNYKFMIVSIENFFFIVGTIINTIHLLRQLFSEYYKLLTFTIFNKCFILAIICYYCIHLSR